MNILRRQAFVSSIGRALIFSSVLTVALLTYVIAEVLYGIEIMSLIAALLTATIVLFLGMKFLQRVQWLLLGEDSDQRIKNLLHCYTSGNYSGFFGRKEKVLKTISTHTMSRLKRSNLSNSESDKTIQFLINEQIGGKLSKEVEETRRSAEEHIEKIVANEALAFYLATARIGVQRVEYSKQLGRTMMSRRSLEIPEWLLGISAMVLFPAAVALGVVSIGFALYLVSLLINPYVEAVKELYMNLFWYFSELFYS